MLEDTDATTRAGTPATPATHRAGRLGRPLIGWLAAAALLAGPAVHAGVVTTAVDFTAAMQNMWGPSGTGAGFNYTQSVPIPLPFGLGTFQVGYGVAASTGQVWGHLNGNIRASFTDLLTAPGATSIGLSYFGDSNGGRLDTTVGARAQLTSSVGNVGPNFTLDAGRTFTPQLDALVESTDTVDPVATLALVNLIAADAGVSLGVTQNNDFRATRIDGTLFYQRQGSAVLDMIDFALDTNAGTSLALNLADVGVYDFWYADLELANSFKASMDLDLNAYARTAVGCGPVGLSECYTSWTVVSPTIYDGTPFALDFGRIAHTATAFSITVAAAPLAEPPTWLLLGALLPALGLRRARRRA